MKKVLLISLLSITFSVLAVDAETGALHASKGDYKTAYNIWKVFAEEGDPKSQFYLGVLYEKGNGVEQSFPQALFWYIKAAEQGVARAHYNIGNLFFNGRGMSIDYKEASRRFRLAADLDFPPAQYNLAYILEQGLVDKKNADQAFKWYLKAAENGLPKAQFKVARSFELGLGTGKDKKKAAQWYKKAMAHKETPEARYYLAMLNLDDGTNSQRGVQLLREAAENGDRLAQYQLGYLYGQGKKVKRDYEQAVFWYKRAAKQQVADAQYLLCLSYSLGRGVPVDVVLAYVWCDAAVENNAEGAEEALQTIKESMSSEQLKAAAKVAPILNPKS